MAGDFWGLFDYIQENRAQYVEVNNEKHEVFRITEII